ncbi:MAG: PAS domain-containing sensor histidine kinase [Pseudomonadales bacterium]|nr:PAS domain-containing sensor histidine kinase [Pseudomonadales bacterium]
MSSTESGLKEEQSQQRSTILRVYNYYRILIGFLFLFLFLSENLSGFIGAVNPDLFLKTLITYMIANVLIGIATLFIRTEVLAKTTPSIIILIGDIIGLTLLVFSSGGVSSGLGNFLIFTCAFGGGLIHGRVSTVLPAIAFILTIYNEAYLFFLERNDLQSFFQAGILGVVFFVANIFFQTASRQLRARESEVFTLEQINQLIIDQMKTGVVVVSHAGTIKSINQAAEKFLSIAAEPEIAREKLPYRLVDRLMQWKEDPENSTISFHTQESSPELLATFSDLRSPKPDSDTLIFIEDSTETQRQAQQLKLASLGRLSASIAHEIRNPLGAISHAAQLLGESTNLDRGDRRLSEIIQTHCVRMNDVIENVLQMSRRRNADPRPLPLNTWLPGFIEEFSTGRAAETDIRLSIEPNDITVNADPLHLSQVLGNLCQNGLRYSEKKTGKPVADINVRIDETTSLPYIEVVDYGEGVSDELIPNLFEPFYTTETSGTGLGLYLSRELCEANSARLSYYRSADGGSCFRISFLQKGNY